MIMQEQKELLPSIMASWDVDSFNESVTIMPDGHILGPSRMATAIGAAFMLVFFVEGLLGNLWIVLAVLTQRRIWNIINLFIASLCFNELLTAGLIVVLIIDSYIWQQWTAGELMCKLIPEFTIAFTGCSLWHTAFIAIHRYIVVCHNNAYTRMSKKAYVTFVLVVARLIPFACTFPGFNLQTSGYVPKLLRCILLPDQGIRIVTITMVQIILPCIIVVLCYALVFCYVMKIARSMGDSNFIQQREIQITKMFGVIFLMILLGFIPYAAVRNADKSNQLSADIYVIVTVFYGIATCSSPLIYGAMSTEIRAVCRSCFEQTCFFSILTKCTPCVHVRDRNRMLSLSQLAEFDVSPATDTRDVQVKDATTQIEPDNKAGLKKNGISDTDAQNHLELEPLNGNPRCFSIDDDESLKDAAKNINVCNMDDSSDKEDKKSYGLCMKIRKKNAENILSQSNSNIKADTEVRIEDEVEGKANVTLFESSKDKDII